MAAGRSSSQPDLRTEDLIRQLALVFQDVYLFDDTLEANIRQGQPEATDLELAEAARLAGVDEIIARLPRGWHTRVGEGGVSLSGGERQRVSIARALVKRAPIVLLDEATAALDPENERYLRRSVRQLAEHSTVLLIAHRLDNVVDGDQIVVVDDGRVAETGTHESLIAAGGSYARLWHARSSGRGWRLTGDRHEPGFGVAVLDRPPSDGAASRMCQPHQPPDGGESTSSESVIDFRSP